VFASRYEPGIQRTYEEWSQHYATTIARADVLLIDDFAMTPITDSERRDLFEVLDDRHDTRSTIISSQIPPKRFHDYINESTHADAICDRLIHGAHRLVLKGPSRRDPREAPEK
jgi:DNA replication protein DnaC